VLLQVGRQIVDGHAVNACRALVALHLRQCSLQVLTLDYCFHRRSCDRRAFETGSRRAGFSLLGGGASGFTRCSAAQVQLLLCLLLHGLREIAALLTSSTVRAFGGALPLTMPSADFCAAVRLPCGDLSLVAETQRSPPEVERPPSPRARRIYHPDP